MTFGASSVDGRDWGGLLLYNKGAKLLLFVQKVVVEATELN